MIKKKTQEENWPNSSFPGTLDLISIFDSMTCGILLMDLARRIIVINRFLEAMTGYSREEVIGVQGENVLRSNLEDKGDPVGKILRSDKTLTLEGDIINQSRKKIPIRFTLSPLKKTTGEKTGVMVIELLPITARTDASVLITGETGTGKDLVAEAIHKASSRSHYPFIKVNCGALPEALLESELFGHVRGAFTGADKDKPGMFRLAHGGTLFLTEIGDLSMPLQVKILTVLDDKEFFPVGGSKKVSVDVRIITATHRDLGELVRQGRFREDLFYRLNVLRLHLPPLKEREEDFRLLLDHFFREFKTNLQKKTKGFNDDCMKLLASYSFPGNVRELRNIVEYAVNVCDEEVIKPEHLPKTLLTRPHPLAVTPHCNDAVYKDNGRTGLDAGPVRDSLTMTATGSWNEVEKGMILRALKETGGNRSKTAELLGWSRSKLWRKIKYHDLV
jgi:PAS domain S-box-containing protein